MKNKFEKNNTLIEWYRMTENEVLTKLNSSYTGLSDQEANERLKKFGKNALPVKQAPSVFKIILNQLANPLIYVLIAATIASVVVGDKKDALFIFLAILLNSAIGAYQEWKAEKSSEALHNLLKILAHVKRNGDIKLLNANSLAPGDIVKLESGGKVPADIRILKQNGLRADESLLTGESTEIIKISDKIEKQIPLSDRENMLFAGSMITSGRGLGVVVETGLNTEIGKIAESIGFVKTAKAPLVIRMEKFSHQISLIVLFACALIALTELLRGKYIFDVFFLFIALAVSAIPEGLPAALTVALSVGMSRMAKRNVIIRKLAAVESLGSCTLIASDKTGTLTVNKQTVKVLYLPNGAGFEVAGEGYNGEGEIKSCRTKSSLSEVKELVKCAVICNEGSLKKRKGKWEFHGDAVDIAFLALGYKYGFAPDEINKNLEVLKEIPFESERKFSANFYKCESGVKVAVKGAFEVIFHFCSHMKTRGSVVHINHKRIEKQINTLSSAGYRVIALAEGIIAPKHNHEYYEEDLKKLTFLGLVGLIDPLRPEAKAAVDTCKQAGIKVIMITGDHPETAYTIAKTLSIVSSRNDVTEGYLLSKTDEKSEEFSRIVNKGTVFARVTPMQKLSIVEALTNSGHYIAVTGDGVNDAPAMKKAHISVAMGSGTDVAKDVSSMIVLDDNFASVVAGVEEGRFAYDNIRKVVYLLVATGVGEITLFALSVIFNIPAPLSAVQLLWLNLVTNGIQGVGLAFEKGEKETMQKPPRNPKESIFNKLMVQETFISGFSVGLIAFVLWLSLISNGISEFSARNNVLLLMVLFENIHVFNCRSEYTSAFKIPFKNNVILITGVLIAQALHVVSMNIPVMQNILKVEAIGIKEWVYLLICSSSLLVIMELFKFFKFRVILKKIGK
ncbi:MAG TPA: HAD-IC family P-type ATPase [Candidatus Gastranaerophilales bacterium]|nr:HAD-IC family P-type ATPase [Candidatus Gastranaerophilales bacterium]